MDTWLPLVLILVFLPLALFGERIRAHLPPWTTTAVLAGTTLFFLVNLVLDPRYAHALFAFLSVVFILLECRRQRAEARSS